MFLSRQDVERFLPHKEPFIFIDSVERIGFADRNWSMGEILEKEELVGLEAVSHFHVRPELDFFRGHFPGNPVVPGVIQIEMMAQNACFIILPLCKDPFNKKSISVALAKVQEAKFRKPLLPNKKLIISTQCIKLRGGMMSFIATINSDNELIAECNFFASMQTTD